MGKSVISHKVIGGRPVLTDITPTVRATGKVARRTRKAVGEFESSNRNTVGKRVARALWG